MPRDIVQVVRELDRVLASRDAIRWLALAVAALAASGGLAIVLVLGRIPVISQALVGDPELARRSLVVHVNLATGVWFFAAIAGLHCLVPGARRVRTAPLAVSLAAVGTIALAIPAWLRPANAVLSDYVPVIDHWLFVAGLAAFAAGIMLSFLGGWLTRPAASRILPPEVRVGLRAAGIAFAIAMLTIGGAYLSRDSGASSLVAYSHLFWGGGHVLQFSATAGMLAVWLLLLHELMGKSALSGRSAVILFGLLLLPTVIGPWLTLTGQAQRAFTLMMELGIFPVVIIVMIVGGVALWRHGRAGVMHWPVQAVALVGLAVSGAMTLIGFAFGAAITGNTTLTPAHYHISIGAVTVSFMTMLLVLLPRFEAPVRWPRLALWQPVLYGTGQTVFATGLAIAGFWGNAARKVYGVEQQVSSTVTYGGLILAGIGGALALAGGAAFIALVVNAWKHRHLPSAVEHATLPVHPRRIASRGDAR